MSLPRVLHLAPLGGISGAMRSMEVLVALLARQGPSHVVTLQAGDETHRIASFGADVIPIFEEGSVPHVRRQRWPRMVRAIRHVVKEEHIDLLHSHSAQLMRYALPVSLMTGVPIVCHQRELYERHWTQRGLGRADCIIAISQTVRDSLPRRWRGKVELIYNAVAGPASIKPYVSDGPRFRIGVAGRVLADKGQDLLIRAASELLNHFDLEVEIWGLHPNQPPSNYVRSLMAQVDALGERASRFRFEKMRDDVEAFYTRMDVVVVPSRVVEGLGRVAIEAMAWGCPVIVAGHGGLVEIVRHESNGLIFRPGDWRDLMQKLELLLADATLRNRLRWQARQDYERCFKPEIHASKVIEVYEKLTRSSS